MFTNFFNEYPQLIMRLSRVVILLSIGFQAESAASTTVAINVGPGGVLLQADSLGNMTPAGTTQYNISCASLNAPVNIAARLTNIPATVVSTELNTNAVIRINGITTTSPASNYLTGFTGAFGIPAPIWGNSNPWIIIAPTKAPSYAFTATSGITPTPTAHGWADGLISPGSIGSAIVMDPTSLHALAQSTHATYPYTGSYGRYPGESGSGSSMGSLFSLTGNGSVLTGSGSAAVIQGAIPSASGILNSSSGQWNIGVTSCGISGTAFTVPGADLQALIAATNGGQLVVFSGGPITATNLGVVFS